MNELVENGIILSVCPWEELENIGRLRYKNPLLVFLFGLCLGRDYGIPIVYTQLGNLGRLKNCQGCPKKQRKFISTIKAFS